MYWEKMGVSFLVYRLNYFECNGPLLDPLPTLKSRLKSVSRSFRLTFCCWRNSAISLNPGRSRGSSLQQLLISCCSYKNVKNQTSSDEIMVNSNRKMRNLWTFSHYYIKKSVQMLVFERLLLQFLVYLAALYVVSLETDFLSFFSFL